MLGDGPPPQQLLYRASQVAELLFWRDAPDSLTPRQLAVLIVVCEDEGVSQTAVMERTGIDRMTTAGVVRPVDPARPPAASPRPTGRARLRDQAD